ncbi:MAG: fibronectin type III domain-containing protein, partial [Endomicrobiales bacterium]|nr:fibronectin type III domain-containing protein [Endomicrobiales bacterium]
MKAIKGLLSAAVFVSVLSVGGHCVPAGISDLTALTGSAVEGSVMLTWTAPDPQDATSAPSNYLVKYSSVAEITSGIFYDVSVSTFNYNWTVFASSGTPESVLVTGLMANVTYYFAVKAEDSSSDLGAWYSFSEPGGVNPACYAMACDTIPAQTQGVGLSYGEELINIWWQANTDLDLKEYRIECSSFSDTGGFAEIAAILPPGTTHQHIGLVNGNTYYYRVRAADYYDHLGFYSTVTSTRPWIALSTSTFTADCVILSTSSLQWAWDTVDSNADGYRIISSTGGILREELSTSTTFWVQAGLPPNTSCQVRVQVFNGRANFYSDYNVLTTFPNRPGAMASENNSSRYINLSWDPNGNHLYTKYTLVHSTYTNFLFFETVLSEIMTTYYIDTALNEGVTYYYRLWAVNNDSTTARVDYSTSTVNIDPGKQSLSDSPVGETLDGEAGLQWVTPYNDAGDSGSGKCAEYLVKWSTEIISAANFDAIPPSSSVVIAAVQNPPTPEIVSVSGLYPGTTYYFGLKAVDFAGNYSVLSNTMTVVAHDRAPDAPSNPAVVALSSSSVHVTWTWPTVYGYDDRDYYKVYRASFTFASFVNNVSTFSVMHPTSYYVDIGLLTEVTYYYRVTCFDKGDIGAGRVSSVLESPLSAITSLKTPDETPPGIINELTALTGSTEGKVDLIWTSPGDDGPTGSIAGGWFRIDYTTDSLKSFTTSIYRVDISTSTSVGALNTHTVTGLTAGDTYYFRIWTADDYLNWSDVSYGATAYAQHDVTPPSVIDTLQVVPYWRQVVFTWTSPGDDAGNGDLTGSFEIRASADGPIDDQGDWDAVLPGYPNRVVFSTSSLAPGTPCTKTITGFTNGTTYYYAIRARDELNNQGAVSLVSPSTCTYNRAPAAFTLSTPPDMSIRSSTPVVLGWAGSSDADSVYGDVIAYHVYFSTDPTFTYPVTEQNVGSSLSYNADFLEFEDYTVYWRVAAVDLDGVATDSTPTSRSVQMNVNNTAPGSFGLSSPADGSITGSQTPTLAWDPSTDVDPGNVVRYQVDYSQDSSFTTYISSQYVFVGTSLQTQTLTENATYWWRVQAFDGQLKTMSDATYYLKVNGTPEPPVAFGLSSPTDGAIITTTTVPFYWLPTSDPDPEESVTYELALSQLSNFSSSITISGLTDAVTSYGGFVENDRYYWRVTAVGSDGLNRVSNETMQLYIDMTKELPGSFNLGEPAYNVIISTTLTPTFSWGAA